MSLFIPTIPQATDFVDFSQGQLLSNNQGLDTVFGIDHYKFSDATVNKGFHNQVTTPNFGPPITQPNSPPTTTANPILYGFTPVDGSGNPTTDLPVIQFSRGVSNAVPTPITELHSPVTGITIPALTSVPIFDLHGMSLAIANVYAFVFANPITFFSSGPIFFNGTTITDFTSGSGTLLITSNGATKIELRNIGGAPFTSNVFWTIEFKRIQF